jgi:hypothetical protein
MISIYDDRSCIGWVLARGCSVYEAFNASEHSLGVLETQNGAVNKIQSTANEKPR